MPPEEQQQRMARMQQQIDENNIYRWAGTLLAEASKLIAASEQAWKNSYERRACEGCWIELVEAYRRGDARWCCCSTMTAR